MFEELFIMYEFFCNKKWVIYYNNLEVNFRMG